MPVRKYDMVDIELIKKAPRRLGEDGFAQLGKAEYWIREREQWPQHVLVIIHSYLRNAHEAYLRNGMVSPWLQGYERRPVEIAPVYVPPPIVEVPLPPTMRASTAETHKQILGFMKKYGGKAALWRLKAEMAKHDVDGEKVVRAMHNLAREGYIVAVERGYYKMTDKVDAHG